MAFRLPGGAVVTAAGVATPGGLVTTFTSTPPAATLSGTWTISDASSAGVGGPADAVVTIHYDTNTANATTVDGFFWERGPWGTRVDAAIPGLGEVAVTRNVRVDDPFEGPVGILTKYAASRASEIVELTAIDFGGVFVLFSCLPNLACQLSGTGPLAHLSGNAIETVPFVPPDMALTMFGSLP